MFMTKGFLHLFQRSGQVELSMYVHIRYDCLIQTIAKLSRLTNLQSFPANINFANFTCLMVDGL